MVEMHHWVKIMPYLNFGFRNFLWNIPKAFVTLLDSWTFQRILFPGIRRIITEY